ncbi:MAG: hypothetical protein RR461_03440 [Angelakisella sp.]
MKVAAAPYSFTGTVTMEGISTPVKLMATKSAAGLTVELLEPEAVKGLMVEFSEDNIKTTYRGLVMNLLEKDIPQQSIFISLREVLSAVPQKDGETEERDGLLTMSGKAGMVPYSLSWSTADLALKTVKLPAVGGVIQVESFQKIL